MPLRSRADLWELIKDLQTMLSGGTTGQVLKKTSGTDYALEWDDETAASGVVSTPPSGSHQVTNIYYDPATGRLAFTYNDTPEP